MDLAGKYHSAMFIKGLQGCPRRVHAGMNAQSIDEKTRIVRWDKTAGVEGAIGHVERFLYDIAVVEL